MKTISNLMMVMTLGAVLSLFSIAACKKQPVANSHANQIIINSSPVASGQTLNASHAPIPGSFLLLGSGVAGIVFLGWKKRTKR